MSDKQTRKQLKKLIKKNPTLKHGKFLSESRFRTPLFRASFAHLYKPNAFEGNDPKYSVAMLFDNDLVELSKLEAAIKACKKEKWGKKLPKKLKPTLRNGEEKEELDGYDENITFATASTFHAPGTVDDETEFTEDIKSGDYCRAVINVYAYDNISKGVGLGLQSVQLMMEGEPFGGNTGNPEEDYDDEEDDEDDDFDF